MSENRETVVGDKYEMFRVVLDGTVDAYARHVFLCYKTYATWPFEIEYSDPLPKLLFRALKAQKENIALKTRLAVCEGIEGTEFSDGDVLIFPEMIKYRGLKESDVDGFVKDVLVNGKPWASGVPQVLAGSYVFVCAHASRDKRCGVYGPPLIEKFKEEIDSRGLKDQVFVIGCSHVGGHKNAGNLIIFSADAEGKVAGHWYGFAKPDDVADFLDQHIAKGEIVERLWRLDYIDSPEIWRRDGIESDAREMRLLQESLVQYHCLDGTPVEIPVELPETETETEVQPVIDPEILQALTLHYLFHNSATHEDVSDPDEYDSDGYEDD